ncbi:MAG: metallophosphoesterase [Actinomycetota bacterium]
MPVDHSAPRRLRALGGVLALGAGATAYSLYEARRPRLEIVDVPVARGPRMSILHIADTHLTGRATPLTRWLRSLPGLLPEEPDLILGTGDFIEDNSGIDRFLEAISSLEARSGKYYVFGSHDYYQSRFKPITRYFSDRHEMPTVRADTNRLEAGLDERGWIPLLNRDTITDIGGQKVRLSGVNDPYIRLHRTEHIERARSDGLAIGMMHAPDLVSQWALNDYDLILAGHTHGGQIRLPLVGAVVTNSTLPAVLAMGLNRIGNTWLYVSPGLGTSRYAPIRALAPPAATLLQLRPAG